MLSLLAIVSFLGTLSVSQEPSAAQPYVESDVYQIYSLLLPREETYAFATGTLIIQQETVASVSVSQACLTPKVAKRFKFPSSDYETARTKKWLLQPQFKIEKEYEIVDTKTLALLEASDQPRPKSGGHVFMSHVGFNKEKTLAIVYMGSICGGLCGHAQFHLFEKVRGKWKEVPAAMCVTSS